MINTRPRFFSPLINIDKLHQFFITQILNPFAKKSGGCRATDEEPTLIFGLPNLVSKLNQFCSVKADAESQMGKEHGGSGKHSKFFARTKQFKSKGGKA